MTQECFQMATNKALIKFSKFLVYILGRKPDEFGLVPDKDGFVKIKELLKAINEEDGWRHIREQPSHANAGRRAAGALLPARPA